MDEGIHNGFHEHSLPLFLDHMVAGHFSDYKPVVTGPDGLRAAIDAIRQIILENVQKDLAMTPEELHAAYNTTLGFKRIEWEKPLDWGGDPGRAPPTG